MGVHCHVLHTVLQHVRGQVAVIHREEESEHPSPDFNFLDISELCKQYNNQMHRDTFSQTRIPSLYIFLICCVGCIFHFNILSK